MKLGVILTVLLPLLSFALVERGVKYQSYVVTPTPEAPVSFVIVKTVITDGCNDYGIEARINPVYSEGPVDTFVLEYGVFHTEMYCDPMPPTKMETLKSAPIKINYDHDTMAGITILIPQDVRVQFTN